jgi:hypothetical protein
VCIIIYIFVYIHKLIHMCIYMYMYTHVCVCIHLHVYIFIIYIDMYIFMCINKFTSFFQQHSSLRFQNSLIFQCTSEFYGIIMSIVYDPPPFPLVISSDYPNIFYLRKFTSPSKSNLKSLILSTTFK